jgi:isopropylmalate/homocitrate/citramalate synthase
MGKEKGTKNAENRKRKRVSTTAAEDVVESAAAATSKVVEVRKKAFACLSPTCDTIVTTSWKDARIHMQRCDPTIQKPNMKDSVEKAVAAGAKKDSQRVDVTDVTEEELVHVVREYYESVSEKPTAKKHVLHRAIHPKYGEFDFSHFGFGSFLEFSSRHGLEVFSK